MYRVIEVEIEIGLIHRPRYDDWSFPKGKIEFGESFLAAAHREVLEETGYAAKFGPLIAEIQYLAEGVPKRVKYWAAQAISAAKPITDLQEVDEFEWHSLKSAKAKLTHEEDRKVLKLFKEISPGIDQNSTLILLRHAKALKRVEWIGDDGDRPLDNRGQIQSEKFNTSKPQQLSPVCPACTAEIARMVPFNCSSTCLCRISSFVYLKSRKF